jgi:hypothetical protein
MPRATWNGHLRPDGALAVEAFRVRCHLHGGRSPGAPKGERNGRWRGGFHTPEAQAERRRLRELIREMRTAVDELP